MGFSLRFFLFLLLYVFTLGTGVAPAAQQTVSASSSDHNEYADLSQSIGKNLEIEKKNIQQLREEVGYVQRLEETVRRELNTYNMQLSIHGNLLLLPTIEIKDLEKARLDHGVVSKAIANRMEELSQKRGAIDHLQHQTEKKYALYEQQLHQIRAERPKDAFTKTLLKQLQTLTELLSTEREILEKIHGTCTKWISRLKQIQQAFTALSEEFDQEISERKKKDLFKRKASPLAALGWKTIREELSRLGEQVTMRLSRDFWLKEAGIIWKSGGFFIVTFLMLFGIIEFLLFRFRHYCVLLEERPFWRQHPWRSLTMQVFRRSLPLLGAALFLYTYAQARNIYVSVSLIRMAVYLLLIWLFCQWGLDFLNLWNSRKDSPLSQQLVFRLRLLLITARIFASLYVVMEWILGSASAILLLARLFFEITLVVWSVSFWKIFRQESALSFLTKSPPFSIAKPIIIGLGYTISLGGFLLELAGYGQLAVYWYTSWGRTAVALLWASLFFYFLREWDSSFAKVPAALENGSKETARPVRWLLIRLCWLAWIGTLLTCLFVAWGARHTVVMGFVGVLVRPIQVGGMRFSLMGFVYAFLILLFTHAATRLWRQIFRKKILVGSGLESGVQDSMTTITVYFFWGVGILMSLSAMGLSTTSLAMAFGALGIGLGFGLQNIFNNFLSGLILLFERPVQVGDVVQVNEIWGTITKINVRSTVVQTFDNASLIIPNSEIISNQVTNWSFRDLRLRRIITVGVAYGSDVELVRETLLEIAHKHPRVFKDPEPEVLFEDFGDSALVFKLRLWSTIDYFISVETDIRFEIDRLFRERNIQIPFPQQDIHIRSVVENTQLEVKYGEGR